MPLLPLLFDRMIDAAVMSFMLLVLGTLGVLCCRQPVRRMRIIVVTLAGCLIAPMIGALPGIPHWSIPRRVRSTENIDRGGQTLDLTETAEIKEPGVAEVEALRSPQRMRELDLNGTEVPSSKRLVEVDPENPGEMLAPSETSENIAHHSLEQLSTNDEQPAFVSTSAPLPHEAPTPSTASDVHPGESGATPLVASAAPHEPVDAGDVRADGPPAIAESPDSIIRLPSIVASYRATILVLYAVGLAAITAWWLVGLVGLLRVLAVAQPAPAACRRLLREIAGSASNRVRLLVSPRAAQPFTFAWRHPVIVLPTESHDNRALPFADPLRDGSSNCVETVSRRFAATPLQTACPSSNNPALPNDALRSALAHEWSHIARGDVWIWSFAGLVRLVYYYQPLCWWLRRQLRLCQDFLADSDAARQSSPTEYAEFLATRALGRPLALGLGITAGKSDLYRRVAMLVRNQRPLEANSPLWWNTLVGTVALGVVIVAATFGDRNATYAAAESADSVSTIALEAPSRNIDAAPMPDTLPSAAEPYSVSTLRDLTGIPGQPEIADAVESTPTAENAQLALAPTEADNKSVDAAIQTIIDNIPAREKALTSGLINFTLQYGGETNAKSAEFTFSNQSFLLDYKERGSVLNHGGHCFRLTRQGESWSLTLDWPRSIHELDGSPSPLIAVHSPLSKSDAPNVRVVAKDRTNGVDVVVLEWPLQQAAEESATKPKIDRSAVPARVQLHVAPQLGYAIVRIKKLNRFGLPTAVSDFSNFSEIGSGIHFPFQTQLQTPDGSLRMVVSTFRRLNEPIVSNAFNLNLPAGTEITDLRPHWNDFYRAITDLPAFDAEAYPLRRFRLLADEAAGLPPTVLAEMDRDVVPQEVWERISKKRQNDEDAADPMGIALEPFILTKDGETKRTPKPDHLLTELGEQRVTRSARWVTRTSTESRRAYRGEPAQHPATVDKSNLRYSGKAFDEWRLILLSDLDPDTRITALRALEALAGAGYADEIVAAVREALKTDQPDLNEFKVQIAAFKLLRRVGLPALPLLEEQLGSDESKTRSLAANSLTKLAEKSNLVLQPLLKASQDSDPSVQNEALETLIRSFGQTREVADVVNNALAGDNDALGSNVLSKILSSPDGPAIDIPIDTLLKLAHSNNRHISTNAAGLLTLRGPATDTVIHHVKDAFLDNPSSRALFANWLQTRRSQSKPFNATIAVPVLIAILEAHGSRAKDVNAPITDEELTTALISIELLTGLPFDGPARNSLPVLIQAAEGKLPDKSRPFRLAAITALGNVKPLPKEALSALKGLLQSPTVPDVSRPPEQNDDEARQLASDWTAAIRTAIRQIEGK